MLRSKDWILPAALAVGVSLLASPADGQSRAQSHFGIGYVANAPSMLAGVAVWGVIPGMRGFGLYADVKTDIDSPEGLDNFDPGLTAEAAADLGHNPFDHEEYWQGANLALLRPITDQLMVYAGAGYARMTRYQEYWDTSGESGQLGWYWVEDEPRSADYVNLMGGVLIGVGSRLSFQFGGETKPGGFTVGASFTFGGR